MNTPERKRIVIIGAGSAGKEIASEMERKPVLGQPVGFIDDDPAKRGQYVSGIRVVGTRDALRTTMRTYKAKTVVIAITEINH